MTEDKAETWRRYYDEHGVEPMTDAERLRYAWLRFYVVAFHRPLTPIVRWLARRLP